MKNFKSLLELVNYFEDNETCRDYLKELRWRDGKYCPACGETKIYEYSNNTHYKCAACKSKFTVTVGTIFHGSHISLRKWFIAIYLVTAHKKGISSCQLARDISVTQKTAWFMIHRIRHAISEGDMFGGNGPEQSVNAPDSVLSQFKRGIIGIYHHVSIKHAPLYLSAFSFRYDTRSYTAFERFNSFLGRTNDRILYKELTV